MLEGLGWGPREDPDGPDPDFPVVAPQRKAGRFIGGFGVQVLVAMVVGLGLGLLARSLGRPRGSPATAWPRPCTRSGAIFVQLLRVLVPPLVFTAIVASIANLRELQNAARLVWRTLLWFAITALIAVAIGIALGLILRPGEHAVVDLATAHAPRTTGSWLDFLTGLVPSNILGLQASTKIVDGAATTGLVQRAADPGPGPGDRRGGDQGRSGRRGLPGLQRLGPGRGAQGAVVGDPPDADRHHRPAGQRRGPVRLDDPGPAGRLRGAIYIGLGLVLFVVYPTILALNGLNPLRFFAGAWPAIQLGFVSRSSIGTLPVTEALTETRLGVPRAYAAFAVPLGATTKMDGCAAIYPAVAAIFIAQFYHLPLALTDYGLIVFVSVLGSAATAGLTGAVVMLTLTLSTLGLPLEGVGLLLAIDPILDMGRTAVNVAGQALVPTIVAKREGILDEAVFNAPAARGGDGRGRGGLGCGLN
jgi:Na+/H+-dicarboxylate symporter